MKNATQDIIHYSLLVTHYVGFFTSLRSIQNDESERVIPSEAKESIANEE
jgi:hypothetical protein